MTHKIDGARGRNIVARWFAMAEQRLEYLTELFDSGRWRRFHSEAAFLENIKEARTAVETWQNLLTCEGSKNNSAIDICWLGAPRTKLSVVEMVREKSQSIPLQPSQTPLAPLSRDILAAAEALASSSKKGALSSDHDQPVPEHISRLRLDRPAIPDRSTIQGRPTIPDRYPLLHNAL